MNGPEENSLHELKKGGMAGLGMQAGDGYHAWIDIEQLLAMKDLMTGCRLPLQHLSQQKCSLAFRCGGGTADDKPAVIAMPHIKFMDLCVHLHEWRSICRVISVFVSMPVGSSAVCPAFDDIITILILFSHRHACMQVASTAPEPSLDITETSDGKPEVIHAAY